MIKFATWVFTIIPILAALALAIDLIPKHGFDAAWPLHAKFHVTWAAAKFMALGIVVAIVAQKALKKAKPWAWYVMLIYLVVGIGGMLPAMLWHEGGGPPLRPLVMTGVMALLMIVALAGSARTVFSSRHD